MKKLILALLLTGSIDAFADSSSATAQAQHVSAYHGNSFQVYGYHAVHIVNNLDVDQDVSFTYTLCVNYGSCKRLSSSVHLKPGQAHDEKGATMSNQNFMNQGTYSVQARTEIFSNEHVDVSNFNTITVF